MALGFILFAIFFCVVLIAVILATVILIISGKYLLKCRKEREQKPKKVKFVFSVIGASLGASFLIFVLINIFRIFVLPVETTQILFVTANETMEISGIATIEQSINSNGTYIRFRFFREYHEILPNRYDIVLYNISDDVEKIEINSVRMIINGDEYDISNDKRSYAAEKDSYSYNLKFDYKSTEIIFFIYNIDIHLINGEIINIEEKTEFKKFT